MSRRELPELAEVTAKTLRWLVDEIARATGRTRAEVRAILLAAEDAGKPWQVREWKPLRDLETASADPEPI